MTAAEKWRRFSELPEDIALALRELPSLLAASGVQLAYLFGSLAQDEQANDVDLALLTEGWPAFQLRQAITTHLGTERVDVVDLRRAPPSFAFEIISTGRVLYAADDEQRQQYELSVLRRYRDTEYLRRRQEGQLKRRMAAWSSGETAS